MGPELMGRGGTVLLDGGYGTMGMGGSFLPPLYSQCSVGWVLPVLDAAGAHLGWAVRRDGSQPHTCRCSPYPE